MKLFGMARTLMRYWKMAHDPRTPKIVRFLIYGGIAYTLMPVDLLPDAIPVLGLIDDAAVLPGVIALSMIMVPKAVKQGHDRKEETEIRQNMAKAA
jgi:uncharacterized membrane protein YkvA (DUF1232 family)